MGGECLVVTIIKAHGLTNSDGFSNTKGIVYCVCCLEGKEDVSAFKTKAVAKDLNPRWDHTGELASFLPSDAVRFDIWEEDDGPVCVNVIGSVEIPSSAFYPARFEGDLTLKDTKGKTSGTISVCVLPVALRVLPSARSKAEDPAPIAESKVDEKRTLVVSVLKATGLRNLDGFLTGKSDPYCICCLKGKEDSSLFKTKVINNDLNPRWNHTGELGSFQPGDLLKLSVWDSDLWKKDALIGSVDIPSSAFYPGGFEGDVTLNDSKGNAAGMITLRVLPLARSKATLAVHEVEASASISTLGIDTFFDQNAYFIRRVMPDSWASKEGLMAGHEIKTINGVCASELSRTDFKAKLTVRPLRLGVKKGASESSATLPKRRDSGDYGSITHPHHRPPRPESAQAVGLHQSGDLRQSVSSVDCSTSKNPLAASVVTLSNRAPQGFNVILGNFSFGYGTLKSQFTHRRAKTAPAKRKQMRTIFEDLVENEDQSRQQSSNPLRSLRQCLMGGVTESWRMDALIDMVRGPIDAKNVSRNWITTIYPLANEGGEEEVHNCSEMSHDSFSDSFESGADSIVGAHLRENSTGVGKSAIRGEDSDDSERRASTEDLVFLVDSVDRSTSSTGRLSVERNVRGGLDHKGGTGHTNLEPLPVLVNAVKSGSTKQRSGAIKVASTKRAGPNAAKGGVAVVKRKGAQAKLHAIDAVESQGGPGAWSSGRRAPNEKRGVLVDYVKLGGYTSVARGAGKEDASGVASSNSGASPRNSALYASQLEAGVFFESKSARTTSVAQAPRASLMDLGVFFESGSSAGRRSSSEVTSASKREDSEDSMHSAIPAIPSALYGSDRFSSDSDVFGESF